MKVNRGTINIDVTGDVESIVSGMLKANKVNTSSYLVNLQLNRIFVRSDKKRGQKDPNTTTGEKYIRNEDDIVNTRLGNIKTANTMRIILNDISAYHSYDTKVRLVIFFIQRANLYTFADHHLIEDPARITSNYNETTLNEIIQSNMRINKLMDDFEAIEYKDVKIYINKYHDLTKQYLKPELSYEDLLATLGTRPLYDKEISNVKIYMRHWINEDYWDDWVEALKEGRQRAMGYRTPSVDQLCSFFGTSRATFNRKIADALNLLVNSHGGDLLNDMTIEEITTT